MEKKTPNKRKSSANSNATPNKIRKADTPLSHNIVTKSPNRNGNKSKSPNKNQNITPKKQLNGNQAKKNKDEQSEIVLNKSTNKIKENQTNGRKSKSPNKNQNMTPNKQLNGKQTTPKKQMNAEQITPKKQINVKQTTPKKQVNAKQITPIKQVHAKQTAPKRNKKSKQEEEDDVELMNDSDEYDTDNSIEEMNDSNVEEAATDEADSDEDAQVDEDESGNEAQVDEDESGDEVQVDEDESGDEVQVDEDESGNEVQVDEDESGDEVQVDEDESGDEVQVDEAEEADSDEDENNDDELENDEISDLDGEEDEEIDEENNDKVEKELSVYVEGLKPALTMDRIFPGCNIQTFTKWKNFRSKESSENAVVFFKDMESLKKALAKEAVNVDGNIIRVRLNRKTQEFGVFVTNLPPDTDVRSLFNDCNILSDNANEFVYFEDKESTQKALLKNGSEVNGNFISVRLTKEIEERVINLTISINSLNFDIKIEDIEDIFEGCNIKLYYFRTDFHTNKLNGRIDVIFEDEESLQKALLKHNTEYNGSVIKLYRKYCSVYIKGIKENTKMEKMFTGCKIHAVELKMIEDTNELKGAVVHFQDYSSLKRAMNMIPLGIHPTNIKHRNYAFGNKSGYINNKFNKPPYQQTHGNEAKKLLLQELKSQVRKLTKEVYGTSRSGPKPFMFARRNPRINN